MNESLLIFVYNANSNLFDVVADFVHKRISPSTYNCSLCSLTHGNFSMKKEWKSFIKALPVSSLFLHKDEFLKQYKVAHQFPAVFLLKSQMIKEIISRQEIESCQTVDEMKTLVVLKLKEYAEHHYSDIQ